MKELSVIICTYNGEKYIKKQLESIEQQTLQPTELIICDDVSTDSTIKIVSEFIIKYKGKTILLQNKKNKGIVKNFEQGMRIAKGEYIAFCDQDDVWLPFKLEESAKLLYKMEEQYGVNTPLLVHTDLKIVDINLKLIASSFMKFSGLQNGDKANNLKKLLLRNYITGCTILINETAKKLSLPFPENIIMHDLWLGLVVAAKGKIEFIEKPTILYRQHQDNSVGAKKQFSIKQIKSLLENKKMNEKIEKKIKQIETLYSFKNGILINENMWAKQFLLDIEKLNKFKLTKFKIMNCGIVRAIIFYIIINKNKIQII